jgi:hypothetical protein
MKTRLIIAAAMALVLGLSSLALAGSTATQSVTYEVQAINEISVSGDPDSLIINTATAGSEPNDATDNSTTYAITTNGSNKKITGAIDTAMPSNVTLKINLTAPTGGTSVGPVVLSATAADLVTEISTVAESGKTIAYTLTATVGAGVVASASKTVTLTIADGV